MTRWNQLRSPLAAIVLLACQSYVSATPREMTQTAALVGVGSSRQLVVVTTPGWTSTKGTMHRFERANSAAEWRSIDSAVPVVVGRTGIAWGVGFNDVSPDGSRKQEGDGKAPAGIFPLDTAFGFAPRESVRLPYVQLLPTTDCVDDTGSAHYNTVVDRASVARVDWNSAEHMREVAQYQIGAIVGYNAQPPVRGRGSCIFLHIWAGPDSHTAGCTAFDETKLREVAGWLDPKKQPLLVQLTAGEYERLRGKWKLPAI
jgi:L,D-peptidoglycan transpeptidase YkuD (ErfK/YbiS/YcfS/YnhG family)